MVQFPSRSTFFEKNNTSISNVATDYQLQLCAPFGGLNVLVPFNFRSLLNKISHPYMAKPMVATSCLSPLAKNPSGPDWLNV